MNASSGSDAAPAAVFLCNGNILPPPIERLCLQLLNVLDLSQLLLCSRSCKLAVSAFARGAQTMFCPTWRDVADAQLVVLRHCANLRSFVCGEHSLSMLDHDSQTMERLLVPLVKQNKRSLRALRVRCLYSIELMQALQECPNLEFVCLHAFHRDITPPRLDAYVGIVRACLNLTDIDLSASFTGELSAVLPFREPDQFLVVDS